MDTKIKIQGHYRTETGTFIVDETGLAQSPIFNDYYELSKWLHDHFVFTMGNGFSINILKMIKKPDVNSFGRKL